MVFNTPDEPRYQVVEIIGRGGMGEVCLADDVMLDRKVALKFVTARGETDGLDQLLGEARAAAALDHPFICSMGQNVLFCVHFTRRIAHSLSLHQPVILFLFSRL